MTTHTVNQVSMQDKASSRKNGLGHFQLVRGTVAALLLGGLLLFVACEEQPYGIFASIEREQDVPDSELGENATIFGMAELDSEYWLSYMRLQRRPAGGSPSDWGNAPHPGGFSSSGDHALSLVGEPGVIYAAFRNNKATSWNVFKRESSAGDWISLATQDHEITRLFLLDNGGTFELFGAAVADRNSNGEANNYKLVQIDTGTPGSGGAGVTATQETGVYPVRGGAFLASASATYEYTFFTQTTVYQGSSFAGVAERSSTIITDPQAAVVFNDGTSNKLYISGRGGVAVSSDGATFETKSGGNTLNGFGTYTSGSVNYLIVGSQDDDNSSRSGDGYYLVAQDAADGASVAGTRGSLARITGETGTALGAENYEGTLLSTAHIRDIYADNNRVFALTVGRGLWSASIENNGELKWLWE